MSESDRLNEFMDRNVKVFTEAANKGVIFGVSYIQRLCKVGYNQASYTKDELLKRNIIKQSDRNEWEFEFVEEVKSNE